MSETLLDRLSDLTSPAGTRHYRQNEVTVAQWFKVTSEVVAPIVAARSSFLQQLQGIRSQLGRGNYEDTLQQGVALAGKLLSNLEQVGEVAQEKVELRVFIGHGRNDAWRAVASFVEKELGIIAESFETNSRTSQHVKDVLEGLLVRCPIAIMVMTPDDPSVDAKARARQNVIHEIGLFQGRHGFESVVLFKHAGVEDFSNVFGLQYISYKEKPDEGFYELGRYLRSRL